jgi:streptomycin 6-kinase
VGAGEVVHPGYRAFVARIGGDAGRAWIASVPGRLEAAAALWQLELGAELPGGVLACVVEAGTQDGREAVLKLPSPWARGGDEVRALRAFAGDGAPELLAADEGLGATLLERIRPGTQPDEPEARAVAGLLGRLRVPHYAGAPPLGGIVARRLDIAEADRRTTGQRLAWAREALVRLEQAPPQPSLVHGDFDERNILTCARRGLCAIDPLPAAGDPLYDAASWIHGNGARGRRARFEALAAELVLGEDDRRRLRDWCGVVAVHG